jgi:hypothetical protein
MELADMTDLKSVSPLASAGSNPAGGTIFCECPICKYATEKHEAQFVTKCEAFVCGNMHWTEGMWRHTCCACRSIVDSDHFRRL